MSFGFKRLLQMWTFPSSICFRKLASTTLTTPSLVITCNSAFLQLSLLSSEAGGSLKLPHPRYFGFCDTPPPNIEQFARAYFFLVAFTDSCKRAPSMSRDYFVFCAPTFSPETGPFPDSSLEGLCFKFT